MKDEKLIKALNVTNALLNPTGFLVQKLVETTINAIAKSEEVTQTEGLDQIRAEAQRQDSAMKMAESQARVAQEIAIARRIENAEEVEMEEYYDYSGEGHVGLKTDGSTLGLGLGGAGKRVSRRVYRFKGGSPSQVSELQLLSADQQGTHPAKS